jgi:hypothetical protein
MDTAPLREYFRRSHFTPDVENDEILKRVCKQWYVDFACGDASLTEGIECWQNYCLPLTIKEQLDLWDSTAFPIQNLHLAERGFLWLGPLVAHAYLSRQDDYSLTSCISICEFLKRFAQSMTGDVIDYKDLKTVDPFERGDVRLEFLSTALEFNPETDLYTYTHFKAFRAWGLARRRLDQCSSHALTILEKTMRLLQYYRERKIVDAEDGFKIDFSITANFKKSDIETQADVIRLLWRKFVRAPHNWEETITQLETSSHRGFSALHSQKGFEAAFDKYRLEGIVNMKPIVEDTYWRSIILRCAQNYHALGQIKKATFEVEKILSREGDPKEDYRTPTILAQCALHETAAVGYYLQDQDDIASQHLNWGLAKATLCDFANAFDNLMAVKTNVGS